MKKIFLVLLVSLMTISLVFAAQGKTGQGDSNLVDDLTNSVLTDSQQESENNNGSQLNTDQQTQNQGENTQLQIQNQIRVQSGNYEVSEGKQMQIQTSTGNELKLKVGNVEARSNMQIGSEHNLTRNKTMLKAKLSNGKTAEIKVMPDTASERAIERLQLKVCNSDNNCSIELKEVGNNNQTKLAYEVNAQKQARVLGLFKTQMQVQAQVDAETGEVIKSKKPWWAFLASE
ncbi:MAG: hypothetical protein PHU51_05740 [Candidatus Nanoarchaeia archaeon]|nr:hypothetical protein [Candidatus Nanoarchaeia archaeon]